MMLRIVLVVALFVAGALKCLNVLLAQNYLLSAA